MSDFNSSLPVRTETAGDVIVKIADATVTSQQLAVNADGSVNITDNGGSITVDAVNLDIRDLTHVSDSVKVGDGTDFIAVNADGSLNITDNGGSLTIDGTISASNFPATVDTNYGTVGSSTIRTAAQIGNATGAANFNFGAVGAQTLRAAAQIGNATGAADFGAGATGAQTLRAEANQGTRGAIANSWPVKITDDTDTLLVNSDGSINVVMSGNPSGTEVCSYNTSAALAGGASVNFDYTVTAATTLFIKQLFTSGSGKIKSELKVETGVATGVYNTKYVGFNSTAAPNIDMDVDSLLSQVAGAKVRVTITNKDNQAQDVYSTLSGSEL